jgi:hypothetical protein
MSRFSKSHNITVGTESLVVVRVLHVKCKDLTYLFSRKHTMDEIISGGKPRNHGLYVAIPDEGTSEALGGMSVGCVERGKRSWDSDRCRKEDLAEVWGI